MLQCERRCCKSRCKGLPLLILELSEDCCYGSLQRCEALPRCICVRMPVCYKWSNTITRKAFC